MNISDFDHGKTKLDKINNYLQETFGFSLKKDDVTPEAIQNILYKVRDKQSEIVNESNINDFHKHPDYAKTIMVAEALAIMLKEVSPTQRKTTRKVKESKMTKKVAEHKEKGMKKHSHPGKKMEAKQEDTKKEKVEEVKKVKEDGGKRIGSRSFGSIKDPKTGEWSYTQRISTPGMNDYVAKGKFKKGTDIEKVSNAQAKHQTKQFHRDHNLSDSVNPRSVTLENLRPLMEQDLDQAELVLAAKDMVHNNQNMAEDLASMQVEDLMPLTDAMRESFGTEQAEIFNQSVDTILGSALDAIKTTREGVDQAIMVLTGEAVPMNDMMGDEMPPAGDMGDEMEIPAEDEFAGDEAEAGNEGEPLGRIPKESIENAKKLLLQHAKNGKLTKASIQEAAKVMAGK